MRNKFKKDAQVAWAYREQSDSKNVNAIWSTLSIESVSDGGYQIFGKSTTIALHDVVQVGDSFPKVRIEPAMFGRFRVTSDVVIGYSPLGKSKPVRIERGYIEADYCSMIYVGDLVFSVVEKERVDEFVDSVIPSLEGADFGMEPRVFLDDSDVQMQDGKSQDQSKTGANNQWKEGRKQRANSSGIFFPFSLLVMILVFVPWAVCSVQSRCSESQHTGEWAGLESAADTIPWIVFCSISIVLFWAILRKTK